MMVHGPRCSEVECRNLYEAGVSAFCEEPPDDELTAWAQAIVVHWTQVAVLPSSSDMAS